MPVKPRTTIQQLEERIAALEADNVLLKEHIGDLKALLVKPGRPILASVYQAPSSSGNVPLSDSFETNRRIAIEKANTTGYQFSEYELNFLKNTREEKNPTLKQRQFMDGLAKKQMRDIPKPDFEYPKSSPRLGGYGNARQERCLGYPDGGFSRFAAAVGDYGGDSYIADRDGHIDLGPYGSPDSDYEDDRFSID